MNTARSRNYQLLFSKWLFAAVLILSFFTFSGAAVKQQSKFAVQKTELVKANESRAKKSISFNRALNQFTGGPNLLAIFSVQVISLAHIHSLRAKTQLIDRQHRKPLAAAFFYQHKTMPNNSSDEPIALA